MTNTRLLIQNQGIPTLAAQSSPSLNQPSLPPKQGTNPIKALLSPQQPNNNLGQAVPQSGNPPGTSWVKPGPVGTQGNSAAFGRPMGSQGSSVGFTPPNVDLGCDHGGSNRPICKAVPPEDIMKIVRTFIYSKTSIVRTRIIQIHDRSNTLADSIFRFIAILSSYYCCGGYFYKRESPDVRI